MSAVADLAEKIINASDDKKSAEESLTLYAAQHTLHSMDSEDALTQLKKFFQILSATQERYVPLISSQYMGNVVYVFSYGAAVFSNRAYDVFFALPMALEEKLAHFTNCINLIYEQHEHLHDGMDIKFGRCPLRVKLCKEDHRMILLRTQVLHYYSHKPCYQIMAPDPNCVYPNQKQYNWDRQPLFF
jgi:hypothetical protein